MLEQQKVDKKSIAEKQVKIMKQSTSLRINNACRRCTALTTKQAELKVAELKPAAEKATAESDKATFVGTKAAAGRSKAAAEAEALTNSSQANNNQ